MNEGCHNENIELLFLLRTTEALAYLFSHEGRATFSQAQA